MASASFSMGKPGEEAVELARLVERCLRGSGALDLEALCVLPGRKVRTARGFCKCQQLVACPHLAWGCRLASCVSAWHLAVCTR